MDFDITITRSTERNVVISINAINEKIDEAHYNDYLKETLNNYCLAGILFDVIQTTYKLNGKIIIVYSGISSKIDLLLKHLNNES